jgi:UDP-N-acetylmuramoyl-L-alanyl-D-glutamate--2,6-diaminopimelate ligase
MKLAELSGALSPTRTRGDLEVEIADLAYDSRRVRPCTLFVCVTGLSSDGHRFAPTAVRSGAAALLCERELPELDVPQLIVADARAAMAPLADRFFGRPSAGLAVLGVTGTNGKTTTAYLTRSILESCGRRCGLLGTVEQVVGGRAEPVERTTPEAIDLQRTFRRMLDAGDVACAIEVSSHALVLGRVDATSFAAAAFTNLTQDHLDFHAGMDDYFAAKRGLFFPAPDRRPAPDALVVNIDDERGAALAAELNAAGREPITFSAAGRANAALRAQGVDFDASGSRFALLHRDREPLPVSLALPGPFNVENALAALGLALAAGVEIEPAIAALAEARAVPGRMEPIEEGQPFAVLVDYAHTPDSLDNVLRAARSLTGGRLISVFGCGGDRDRAKRPLMGRAGSSRSDLSFITSDNPRSEPPAAIIGEILAGVEAGAQVEVVEDRRAAIAAAFAAAGPGDLVVIAGKGHEQGQEFEAGRKIPFDDRVVAREELRGPVAAA